MFKGLTILLLIISCQALAEDPQNKLGIILLGDSGRAGANQTKVAKAIENFCKTELCSMGLLLGDNIYETGVTDIDDPQFETKFEEAYKNLTFQFHPVLGNHDVLGNWRAEVEYGSPRWFMGGRYYAIHDDLVDLYGLDSNLYVKPDKKHSKKQQDWLANELATYKAPWKIVYAHHPVFSSGAHGDTPELVKKLKPLLEANAVDIYISGHDHDQELLMHNGLRYIVSGTGCCPRPVKPGRSSVFACSGIGFGYLLLQPQVAKLQFINGDGKIEFETEFAKHN